MRPSTYRTIAAILSAAAIACFPPSARAGDPAVNVFAAASLTGAFRAVGTAFEAARPGTKVSFNFAGSPTLVQQIREGAPADVFASADEPNMQKVADAHALADTPRIFARNLLQIVVGKGNPRHITGLPDLARPGLVVVLCDPAVPAGRYALAAFSKAGVTPPAGSRELDVKAVVTKVALGEADAGVVYVTDVRSAGDKVEGVGIAESHNVVARYPIAVLTESTHAEGARAFVDFVLSEAGRTIMRDHGFLNP